MAEKEKIPHETQAGDVSIPERLRVLNTTERFAVLATNDNGQPYTSLVSYACTADMKRVLFVTPKNTRKYDNIMKSTQVALLIDSRSGGENSLLDTEAITLLGIAKPLRKGKVWYELAQVFLDKHPDLSEFLKSPSSALIVVDVTQCVHVSRFQTVSVWDGQ